MVGGKWVEKVEIESGGTFFRVEAKMGAGTRKVDCILSTEDKQWSPEAGNMFTESRQDAQCLKTSTCAQICCFDGFRLWRQWERCNALSRFCVYNYQIRSWHPFLKKVSTFKLRGQFLKKNMAASNSLPSVIQELGKSRPLKDFCSGKCCSAGHVHLIIDNLLI